MKVGGSQAILINTFLRAKIKKNLFDFVLERQNGSYYRVLEFDIYLTWIYLV